jgi:uncharacterized protein (DUF362 family)
MLAGSVSDRREFLLRALRLGGLGAGTLGLGAWLSSRSRRPEDARAITLERSSGVAPDPNLPELVVVQNGEPAQLARAAFDALGGVRRFVGRGDVVLVKPNVGWDRTPEQAANTNPQLLSEIIRLCYDAGARKVVVSDVSCNETVICFERSGIADAARSQGAEIILPEPRRFKEVDLRGDAVGVWPVLEPFLAADKVINLPIAKHHSLTGVTLGMKNWYGILGGQRSRLHQRIDESLADLSAFMRPTLTIVDAYRVLMRNGPTGGSLADVEERRAVVASTDPVAVDAYVAKAYWDLDARRLGFLRVADERGLGTMKFEEIRSRVVDLTAS